MNVNGLRAVLRRFEQHHDKVIYTEELQWYNAETDIAITIACDPPVPVRVEGIFDIQTMDGYTICCWVIRILNEGNFNNVETLYVKGLSSDENRRPEWRSAADTVDEKNIPPRHRIDTDPRIATSKWRYWTDSDDSGWRTGIAPADESE
jgi:hypothetical protein